MAERVAGVGRPPGVGDHDQGERRAEEIDQRFQRVGKKADRPGHPRGAPLQCYGRDRCTDRQPKRLMWGHGFHCGRSWRDDIAALTAARR